MGALLAVSSPASRGRASGPSLLAARPCPPPRPPSAHQISAIGASISRLGESYRARQQCARASARCKIKRPSRKECLQFESIAVTALLHNTGLGHPHPIRTILSLSSKSERKDKQEVYPTTGHAPQHTLRGRGVLSAVYCLVISHMNWLLTFSHCRKPKQETSQKSIKSSQRKPTGTCTCTHMSLFCVHRVATVL